MRTLFPLVGCLALIWYLLRVLPKPSRALYPCQRAAAPLAGGFLVWLAGAVGSAVAWRRGRELARQSRWRKAWPAFAMAAAGVIAVAVNLPNPPLRAAVATAPHDALGAGRGLHPGRVVWVHAPDAVHWDGYASPEPWWGPTHTDQTTVDEMVASAVRGIAGASTDGAAWDALFRHFNETGGRGAQGYQPGEKIAIKLNLVTCNGYYGGADPTTYEKKNMNTIDNSPQMILALLRQLVYKAGVNPADISIGDPTALFPNHLWNFLSPEFPQVHYFDYLGGAGRTRTEFSTVPMGWSTPAADGKVQDYLPLPFAEARYLINFAILKGHGPGVTLCAKNHYGSLLRMPMGYLRDAGILDYYNLHLTLPDTYNPGTGKYRALVDLMGHPQLGGKTLLYLIDGLFAGLWAYAQPSPWKSRPFGDGTTGAWPASLFVSQDPVAIDSVAYDFLLDEWPDVVTGGTGAPGSLQGGAEDYLHEAALADNPPSGSFYDPAKTGSRLSSLGVHEHWNNTTEKLYSRNLGGATGIELVRVMISSREGFMIDGESRVCAGSANNTYAAMAPDGANHSWSISGDGVIVGRRDGSSVTVAAGASGSFRIVDSVMLQGYDSVGSLAVTVDTDPLCDGQGNQRPAVTLTAPASGTDYVEPATITMSASATDPDGTVERVEFYSGATLLWSATAEPYQYTWSGIPRGRYTLTARAFDDRGGVTVSAPAVVTATNPPPTVVLTAPLTGMTCREPAAITLTATASDPNGTVSKVEFYQGSTLLGTATAEPYSFTWNNVDVGTYLLTARAYDNSGAVSTSTAATVTVTGTVPKNVALQASGGVASASSVISAIFPASAANNGDRTGKTWGSSATQGGWADTTITGYPDWVQIDFSSLKSIDTIGVVTLQDGYGSGSQPTATQTFKLFGLTAYDVQYWDGSQWVTVGSAVNNNLVWRTFTFAPVTTDRIRVVVNGAKDGRSRIVEIEAYSVSTPAVNSPPTVSLTSPADGASSTAPATVVLTAAAADSDGTVSRVDFYNGATLLGSATASPWSWAWSSVPAGTYTLTAVATDNAGATTTSEAATITVTAPAVRANVALAANGGVAAASSVVSAVLYPPSATNNGDLTGQTWGKSSSGGGWADATHGAYPDWVQITFSGPKSIDEIGVVTLQDSYTAGTVPVKNVTTFKNLGLTGYDVQYCNLPAGLTCLGSNDSHWTTVGSATANNLVWRSFAFPPVATQAVRVKVGGTKDGRSRIVEIEAYSAGAAATNAPPSVSLTSPAAGASFTAPAAVTLTADAADSDGTVTRVDFYNGATLLGSATASPWSCSWHSVPAGSYSLTAVATDNDGATTASAAAAITVTAVPTARTNVALAANGGVATASSTVSPLYPALATNNGDLSGQMWGKSASGGGWADATLGAYPDWVQITFSGRMIIDEVGVVTLQDAYTSGPAPVKNVTTFKNLGLTGYEVQYCNLPAGQTCLGSIDSHWATAGGVTGNNLVWRSFLFTPVTTQAIRVKVTGAKDGRSRIVEIEAYSAGAP